MKRFNSYLIISALILLSKGFVYSQILPDTLINNFNSDVTGTAWSFTAVHITDIHLGEDDPDNDFGTAGWIDTVDNTTNDSAAMKLRNVVHWINNNKNAEKIELVFVTGDISDQGEKSGHILAKRILDSLLVPYIIMPGNHDMWPRNGITEAPVPYGDSLFAKVYAPHFIELSQQLNGWNDGTRLNRIYNSINNIYSQFQNYSFSFGNYRFVVSDFASRYHKPTGVGANIDGVLYNISGGPFQWLQNSLASLNPGIENGLVLLQHYPLDDETLSYLYSFDSNEFDSIADMITPHNSKFGLCIAGHRHRDKVYNIKKSLFSSVLGTGLETDANADFPNGHIRLVRFWDNYTQISSLETEKITLYPNPASDYFSINLLDDENAVEVYNSSGVLIFSETGINSHNIISTKCWSDGIYQVVIKGKTKHTERILIRH